MPTLNTPFLPHLISRCRFSNRLICVSTSSLCKLEFKEREVSFPFSRPSISTISAASSRSDASRLRSLLLKLRGSNPQSRGHRALVVRQHVVQRPSPFLAKRVQFVLLRRNGIHQSLILLLQVFVPRQHRLDARQFALQGLLLLPKRCQLLPDYREERPLLHCRSQLSARRNGSRSESSIPLPAHYAPLPNAL